MSKVKRIKVRGAQRSDIDPVVFLQVLLAIGAEWEAATDQPDSVDAFNAAVQDSAVEPRARRERSA